ncbi:MAG: hypothetical protein M1379_17670 [Firmicutes bacterium]|nr:hypothetical protein [Bacillota bacterium]
MAEMIRKQFYLIWAREKDFIEALRKKGPLEGGRRWRREDLYDRVPKNPGKKAKRRE